MNTSNKTTGLESLSWIAIVSCAISATWFLFSCVLA